MIIGALITMVFFFAYSQVKTNGQNLGFTAAISFCLVSPTFLLLLLLQARKSRGGMSSWREGALNGEEHLGV